MCTLGAPNLCDNVRAIGVNLPGSCAEFVIAPAAVTVRLADSLDAATGALIEPLSCVLNATQRAPGWAGQIMVIVGAGCIGQLATAVAVHHGAAEVDVVEPNEKRRAQALAMLLVPLRADYVIPLRRAQDVRQACIEAYGPPGDEDSVVSLRELLAVVSAHEWRKKGVPVPAVQGRIYPHYAVFSPVRGEYVDLVATAPLPAGCELAFDIGTGSGIIAAVLARRGVKQVIATDQDERALACAFENIEKLRLTAAITLLKADLFPEGRAPLVVCNPPWVPAQPTSPIEYAVYDPASRMLRGFLGGLAEHLTPDGEGWLIISDIAEHLGLRSRDELLDWIKSAGLKVIARLDTRPKHPKAQDAGDPLHAARAAEVTSLWRLARLDGIN